jgi:hypothetical protein
MNSDLLLRPRPDRRSDRPPYSRSPGLNFRGGIRDDAEISLDARTSHILQRHANGSAARRARRLKIEQPASDEGVEIVLAAKLNHEIPV